MLRKFQFIRDIMDLFALNGMPRVPQSTHNQSKAYKVREKMPNDFKDQPQKRIAP